MGTTAAITLLLSLFCWAPHARGRDIQSAEYYKYQKDEDFAALAVHTKLVNGEACSSQSGPLMDTVMAGRISLDAVCRENQWKESSLLDARKIDQGDLCGAVVVVKCSGNIGGNARIPQALQLD